MPTKTPPPDAPEPPPGDEPHGGKARKRGGMTLGGRLRAYFFAGILVTAPASITFYTAWTLVTWIDRWVAGLLPAKYNPALYMPVQIPGVGLLVLIVALILIGMFAAGFLGRMLVRLGEGILAHMPVIRSIYGAIKQIFETVLAQQSNAFRQVVLVEYPRRGIWALGFVSGTTMGEVQHLTDDEVINVFLPTTPNPTSGFLLFVPKRDLRVLTMSVEEGIKMVVSGGIVTPPYPAPMPVPAEVSRTAAS